MVVEVRDECRDLEAKERGMIATSQPRLEWQYHDQSMIKGSMTFTKAIRIERDSECDAGI